MMKNAVRLALLVSALGLVSACASSGTTESPRATAATYGCAQLGEPAKAAAAFYDGGHVYAARPVHRTVSRTKAFENRQIAGAELDMHAAPGVTAEQLQRALACQAASATAAHPSDPLHPRGRVDEVGVRSTGAGFTVSVLSDDRVTATEIWERSQSFAGEGASVEVRQVSQNGS
jgi:hypothetical protein